MPNYTKVIVLYNEIEADLLDEILTNENIPHLMRSYHDSAYDGIFQAQKGWGHIEAPENYKDKIIELYNELNRSLESDEN